MAVDARAGLGRVLEFGGNGRPVRAAATAAREAGLPAGWLVFRQRDWRDGIGAAHWSASRGFKPITWPYAALACGLNSTLEAGTLPRLRELAWRQEVLTYVWVITATLLAYRVPVQAPGRTTAGM